MKRVIKRSNWHGIVIHILVWSILLLFPMLASYWQEDGFYTLVQRNWIPTLRFALIFYLNYFLFTRLYYLKKRYKLFILANLLICSVLLWGSFELRSGFKMEGVHKIKPPSGKIPFQQAKPPPSPRKPMIYHPFLIMEMFSLVIPVIFAIAIRATENLKKSEIEIKDIQNQNLESELKHLRYQIHPHFLFNSLNNIYSLVEVAPDKAQDAIHTLSALMRYMLYDAGKDMVTLDQELSFLNKYIQLMSLRQTDKVKIVMDFPVSPRPSYKIAPLLLIPLIENAFKHGVSATTVSIISFSLRIDERTFVFTTKNPNIPKGIEDQSGSGIGLSNLKQRLDLIYANNYSLLTTISGGEFQVVLTINTKG